MGVAVNQEILEKVCLILNTKEFEASEELLSELDRIIAGSNKTTKLDNFIDDINNKFGDRISFSNEFMADIYNLSSEELTFIFHTYFKYKEME